MFNWQTPRLFKPAAKIDSNADLAAIDLGSNSFHMVIARYDGNTLGLLDRLKEPVRLAAGLNEYGDLDAASQTRAIDCLARFGQRLRTLPPGNIRAVGTNTLRRASAAGDFLQRAEAALGHRIDIVPGAEEARLIYLGVAQSLGDAPACRLVIDIGGGSTELIIGDGQQPQHLASLQIGCVALTQAFFADGEITAHRMQQATLKARRELESIENSWRKYTWDIAIGASGTATSAASILATHGQTSVTLAGLYALRDDCIAATHIDQLQFPGLSDDRRPVFPAGLAALIAVFESLQISSLQPTSGAMREGILHDLLGRGSATDPRQHSVHALAERYGVDHAQALRVQHTARHCLQAVAPAWELDISRDGNLLDWAAELHEIGLAIAYARYHRHSEYLIRESNLSGFSQQEQQTLALLVRSHRKNFPEQEMTDAVYADPATLAHLAILLRVAVVLHRSRSDTALPDITISAADNQLTLQFPPNWLDEHPLTQADLEDESKLLAETAFELCFY